MAYGGVIGRSRTTAPWRVRRPIQAPFTAAQLVDEDYAVDFSQLTRPVDKVAIIATVPLTDNETWTAIKPGELLTFSDGTPWSPGFGAANSSAPGWT